MNDARAIFGDFSRGTKESHESDRFIHSFLLFTNETKHFFRKLSNPMDSTRLNQVFEQFATFGVTNKTPGPVTMDNARFAKLCRDTKIIDKSVTMVDVDIFFKKVRFEGDCRALADSWLSYLVAAPLS